MPGRSEPRAALRVTAAFAAVAGIAACPREWMAPATIVVAAAVLWMRPPWPKLARRWAQAAPVILLAALFRAWNAGQWEAASVVAWRGSLALFLLAALAAVTPWRQFLGALEWLRMPRPFLAVLVLTERYAHLFGEEFARLRRARDSRMCRRMALRERLASEGQLLGALMLRTEARAARIHAAMLARGFRGTYPKASP